MAQNNICNTCGANYEYKNGRWVCPACGAYKPEELSNEEVTLLYNAAAQLRMANFDGAEDLYMDMIQKYPKNPDAHWGLPYFSFNDLTHISVDNFTRFSSRIKCRF